MWLGPVLAVVGAVLLIKQANPLRTPLLAALGFYLLVFHSLANLPVDVPLYRGALQIRRL